jgi:hypothetical protein
MANTSVPAAVARAEIVAQSHSEARRFIKWPVWQALPVSAIDVTGPAADPASPEIEDTQYAIVDLRTSVRDVTDVTVVIQLSGSRHWYSSRYERGFPLHGGGRGRTAVKLPLNWRKRTIT